MSAPAELRIEAAAADTFALSGELVFGNAAACLQRIRAALAAHAAPILDLAGVSRADSAGLAVLLALAAEGRAAGRSVRLRGVPAGLRALAHLGEVESLLGLVAG